MQLCIFSSKVYRCRHVVLALSLPFHTEPSMQSRVGSFERHVKEARRLPFVGRNNSTDGDGQERRQGNGRPPLHPHPPTFMAEEGLLLQCIAMPVSQKAPSRLRRDHQIRVHFALLTRSPTISHGQAHDNIRSLLKRAGGQARGWFGHHHEPGAAVPRGQRFP